MHVRRAARDAFLSSHEDDAFFGPRGDVVFSDATSARAFADRIRSHRNAISSVEVAAMSLVHEILHAVVDAYRSQNPSSFDELLRSLHEASPDGVRDALLAFLKSFPTSPIYRSILSAERVVDEGRKSVEAAYAPELLLLWLTNQNPAYEPIRELVTDRELGPSYQAFVEGARRFFADGPRIGPRSETLVDLLLAPIRHAPNSILEQLDYIEAHWGQAFNLDRTGLMRRITWLRDIVTEEGAWFVRRGAAPGPGTPLLDPMQFVKHDEEPKRFSQDLDWMPNVVLIAKTVYVWLDQLSKKYSRAIERLDQIPDEELRLIASRGFSGLWLIGLFERSVASRKIKQRRGDHDAVASAYSLKSYSIAEDLGGHAAYEALRERASAAGLRLAADMVPNHVGIDADWVVNHPDWFVSVPTPPFPGYRFGGEDLSDDSRVGIFLEEGYWSQTDAAVVFRRHDRWSGANTYVYHGNDGTSMPWNDTAQLDYTKPEVRHAVIETILHVARMFPIIRFDAAMTLAKRHFQRLWFPLPGQGGAIPSRADHAMTHEEFNHAIPVEFWREVVDTVAARAPDTLLLAEAFWMMEGYFVRSLGMHRVYNSAFMNMLKREENEKYRATIKNVLDFDPEVLKRFVNFMNNPDEDTAIAQFGLDDKYFGVCTLMSTMPGLPMFGHGQVEGLTEKYGMEYRRPKWDERPNVDLVARHEREIFPLLKRRSTFSGVTDFALYDFVVDGGGVDEDVFAYTNRDGDSRAVVLYNNKYKQARGRITWSVPSRRDDQVMASTSVSLALGVSEANGDYVAFRDLQRGTEFLRSAASLSSEGLFWELSAFEYRVFGDFRAVRSSDERPYAKLARELEGRGVPSIESAVTELYFRPIHAPLRNALGEPHLRYLVRAWDEKTRAPLPEATKAFVERLQHVVDGHRYMTGQAADASTFEDDAALYVAAMRIFHPEKPSKTSRYTAPKEEAELLAPSERDAFVALSWIQLRSLGKCELELDALEVSPEGRLAILLSVLPEAPITEVVLEALGDARGRTFLGVHEATATWWLVKERLDELARALAIRDAILGKASLALAKRQVDHVMKAAEAAGYDVESLSRALKRPS